MIEAEIKLPVEDRDTLIRQLLSLGFKESMKIEERDLYYDNKEHFIQNTHQALRIRTEKNLKTGETTSCITFKGQRMDKKTVTRPEYETQVSDGENASQILMALGYMPVQPVVIKERFMYSLNDMTACADRVQGLGDFLELEILTEKEGKEEAIKRIEEILHKLGYTLNDTVQSSYLSQLMKRM